MKSDVNGYEKHQQKEIKKKQLNAVSRTQQGRQREPIVKTLRSPFSAGFWRHCVLSGRTQRRARKGNYLIGNAKISSCTSYFYKT